MSQSTVAPRLAPLMAWSFLSAFFGALVRLLRLPLRWRCLYMSLPPNCQQHLHSWSKFKMQPLWTRFVSISVRSLLRLASMSLWLYGSQLWVSLDVLRRDQPHSCKNHLAQESDGGLSLDGLGSQACSKASPEISSASTLAKSFSLCSFTLAAIESKFWFQSLTSPCVVIAWAAFTVFGILYRITRCAMLGRLRFEITVSCYGKALQ